MLLHPADYAFTSKVERGFEIIFRELLALTSADFLEWPDRSAYGGNWLVAPLFMSSHYPGIESHFAENQRKCPRTTEWLRAIPGVTAAAFSWMEPGCHIYAHRDAKALQVLRAHLPLVVPPGALMRVGSSVYTWEVGRCILFDGYIDHETGNTGDTRRVILMVDACVTDVEFERLQAWRTANRLEIDPKLVLRNPYTRQTVA
ncbi:MAG TPA: aspartyl/asparaginyl beta-hydroxylase domain-containing protein [Planctomycetota bacterium]